MLDYDLEIISGSLLSDGCITKIPKCKNYYFIHGCKHVEYIEFLAEELSFITKVQPYKARVYHAKNKKGEPYSGQGSAGAYLKSRVSEELTEMRKKWYPNGKKSVPLDLILTPTTVLHWYLGDGNNRPNEGVRLCTCGFISEDNQRLVNMLLDIVPECSLGDQNMIHIPQTSAFEFFQYIKQPPLDCFAYKFETSAVKSYHGRICEFCHVQYKARQCNQRVCSSVCGRKLWKKERSTVNIPAREY